MEPKAYLYGSKGLPLNQYGIEQAQEAAKNLARVEIASITTSPLKRATRTAEIIAEAIKKPITFIEELKEWCSGIKEGQMANDETFFKEWLEGHDPD